MNSGEKTRITATATSAHDEAEARLHEMRILGEARRVISVEAEALRTLAGQLGEPFVRAVSLIRGAKGKVVVTGMGKSGLVGQKIAATLASTGTPACFLHPAEGLHGDVGMIREGDVVLAISKSGETDEVVRLLPAVKRLGGLVVALTDTSRSTLARSADVCLEIAVESEACPLGLAPTASTTVALALGDALAVVLLQERGFGVEDFALRHPGGSLGRRLLLRVDDVMHAGADLPLVGTQRPMSEVLLEISARRLGVAGVVDDDGCLVGVITDGDLRRALERGANILSSRAGDLMHPGPKRIENTALAASALRLMEEHSITSLFVVGVEDGQRAVGIVHLHDLLKAGLS